MPLISLIVISLIVQQELAPHIELEAQPLEDWLAQLELQHEIESDYYHACGRW